MSNPESIKKKEERAIKKFEMRCERDITDIRGHEICPGHVVAVSRSGSYSKVMDLELVTSVLKGRIVFGGMDYQYLYDYDKRTNTRYHYLRPNKTYTKLSNKDEFIGQVVVIDNPLYAINNPQIENILRSADALKSAGIFPSDYKLGTAVMKFEEEDTE